MCVFLNKLNIVYYKETKSDIHKSLRLNELTFLNVLKYLSHVIDTFVYLYIFQLSIISEEKSSLFGIVIEQKVSLYIFNNSPLNI